MIYFENLSDFGHIYLPCGVNSMQNSIEAVVWDMGGVILRTEDPIARRELAKWLDLEVEALYSIVFDSETSKKATLGLISEEEHWNCIQNQLCLGDQDMHDFRYAFFAGDWPDKVLIEYIDSLRPRYRTALLSNAWSGARQKMSTQFDMLSIFDICVFSAEIGIAKPDPAIFQYLLNELGFQPEKVVFIDDVKENVESAKSLGMQGIVFQSRQQTLDELGMLPIKQPE
jgi:epoxide hydrolase-like predicted phosphatase